MTREERLKQGWVEWWSIRYGTNFDCWVAQVKPTQGRHDKSKRLLFPGHPEALRVAAEIAYPVRLTIVWRRNKPKQPPPLKVGDVVTIRGKVVKTRPDGVLGVETPNSGQWALSPLDVVR